jgi:hypothetical protein
VSLNVPQQKRDWGSWLLGFDDGAATALRVLADCPGPFDLKTVEQAVMVYDKRGGGLGQGGPA